MKLKKILRNGIMYPVRNAFIKANYHLENFTDVVWIIGDGRSGTTWLGDLINHQVRYRQLFEPFHPLEIERMKFMTPYLYMRSGKENQQLASAAHEIFTGKFMHERVDVANYAIHYNGLLVKDIFANLFAHWLRSLYPEIKIILLVRNPFSVAVSKYKRKDWLWITDPMVLLDQHHLHADYLEPFGSLIRKISSESDYIVRQVLIWSILYYVPLRQFDPGTIHIAFYEDVFSSPEQEVQKIVDFIGQGTGSQTVRLNKNVIKKPSRVAGKESTIIQRTSPLTSWKKSVTSSQVEKGMKILQEFGFDGLYDEQSRPDRRVIERLHRAMN